VSNKQKLCVMQGFPLQKKPHTRAARQRTFWLWRQRHELACCYSASSASAKMFDDLKLPVK